MTYPVEDVAQTETSSQYLKKIWKIVDKSFGFIKQRKKNQLMEAVIGVLRFFAKAELTAEANHLDNYC